MRFHCINFTSFCHWQSNLLFWINLFLSNKKQCDGNFFCLVMASICFPGAFDLEFGEQWQELEWGTNNSFSCIFTADPQRSVWLVLCIRRLTLIHLSSVLRKFSRVHLKHLHSHSPEAFQYPWSRVSLESSYLSFTSAKDLTSDSGSFQSPSDAGANLWQKPTTAMDLDSSSGSCFQSGSVDRVKIIPVLTVHPSHFLPLCPLVRMIDWKSHILLSEA